MILGSHNSWTCYHDMPWWQKPFAFMGRCQKLSIKEQYAAGVRLFDLRLAFIPISVRDGVIWGYKANHGFLSFAYVCTISCDLQWLGQMATEDNPVYVRVTLEQNSPDKHHQKDIEKAFWDKCNFFENFHPRIKFFRGVRKFDGKPIYGFRCKGPDLPVHEYCSSVTSITGERSEKWYSRLDDLWPWLYAKLHNKKLLERFKSEDCYLMLDFIKKDYGVG